MAVLTLAGLTIKEAMRRRLFIGGLLIALIFVLFAFLPLHIGDTDPDSREQLGKSLAWLGCGMIKFFASVLAVTLAAGAITAEVEKGVLSVVVPKPLSRVSIYMGKWLGLIVLLAVCLVVWGLLLAFAVWHQTHTFHSRIFLGVLTVGLFPLLFTTLTLFFSSFANFALSAGLALIAAGISLTEDLVLFLSAIFQSSTLKTVSKVVGYIVPLGKMNHWITRGLGNAGMDLSAITRNFSGSGPQVDASKIATSTGDMVYILGYIVVFLALGLFIFQKRDL